MPHETREPGVRHDMMSAVRELTRDELVGGLSASRRVMLVTAMMFGSHVPAAAQTWPYYYEPYCPWCYQQPSYERGGPIQRHREHAKPKPVVHKAKRVLKLRPERRANISVDEERAAIKERVNLFCGRHPKDVACQPQQTEPPKEQ